MKRNKKFFRTYISVLGNLIDAFEIFTEMWRKNAFFLEKKCLIENNVKTIEKKYSYVYQLIKVQSLVRLLVKTARL